MVRLNESTMSGPPSSPSFLRPSSSSSSPPLSEGGQPKKKGGFKGLTSQLRKRKRRGGFGSANDSVVSLNPLSEEVGEDEGQEADNVSLASLDVTLAEAPDIKRSKTMSRVTSLASVVATPMAKMGHALSRSISSARLPASPSPAARTPRSAKGCSTPTRFGRSMSSMLVGSAGGTPGKIRAPESPYGTLKRGAPGRNSSTNITPYKPPQPTPNKQRPTRFWSSQFADSCDKLKEQEIKMQEAIYEISCGEEDLVEDMGLVKKIYADSLLHLNILTPQEFEMVFGGIKNLLPLHIELYRGLRALRSTTTGISKPVGKLLAQWVTGLREPYVDYCSTLTKTKTFLDFRRESDKDFRDFLQRCLESPFSRKLDVWAYLDVPRSRLVKYPLLIKQVLKFSECPNDCALLSSAIHELEDILKSVDQAMAQTKCQITLERLVWLDELESQNQAILDAKEEMLEGVLRNNRGTKLECHLLDTVLILGRPASRGECGVKRLQVYRIPIPVEELVVEDLEAHYGPMGSGSSNGSGKQGSFKRNFTNSQPNKNSFKVSFRKRYSLASNCSDASLASVLTQGSANGDLAIEGNTKCNQTSHTLIAPDEHSKRQWVTSLQKTIDLHFARKNRIRQEEFERRERERTLARGSSREECDSVTRSTAGSSSSSTRLFKMHGAKASLFQKNKRSPRIKASLSYAGLENLKRGSAIKRMRNNASSSSTSALRSRDQNTPLANGSSAKVVKMATSGSVGNVVRKRKLGMADLGVTPLAHQQLLRGRTKSWSHLNHESNSTKKSSASTPRYMTRSTTKISKSMSDLLQV